MKKAISITLNGIVFMIEEDALQSLSAYFDSIKAHYGPDGEEITRDIEADIADRFKARGSDIQKVININDVEEIIKVMGTVNQIGDEDEKVSEPGKVDASEDEEVKRPKRLYRDGDNVILGGVCSGLGIYFSIDPVVFRLLFVILTIMNGIGILIYLVFWLAVPLAKTSVQKLEMQGESINLKNIEEALREKSEQIKEEGKRAFVSLRKQKSSFARLLSLPVVLFEGLLKFVKSFFNALAPIARVLVGLFLIFGVMFSFIFMSFWMIVLLFKTDSSLITANFPIHLIANSRPYFVTVISSYIAFLIPMFAAMLAAVSILRRKNLFNWIIVVVLMAAWMFSVTVVSVFGFDLASNIKTIRADYISKNTIEKKIDIAGFNGISGNFRGNVKIERDDNFSITIWGLKDDVERIGFVKEATSSTGVVSLVMSRIDSYHDDNFLTPSQKVNILIKMPQLKQLDTTGLYQYSFDGFSEKPTIVSDEIREKELNDEDLESDLLGGDRDEHNCIQSAGYRWCEGSEKCIRPWEEVCESEINFSESGTVVKNLPGLKKDKLYLIHERAGQPGLKTELIFDAESLCGNDEDKISCMLLSVSDYGFNNGRKIKVRGVVADGAVRVREVVAE